MGKDILHFFLNILLCLLTSLGRHMCVSKLLVSVLFLVGWERHAVKNYYKLIIEAACFLMPIIILNHNFLPPRAERREFTIIFHGGRKMSFSLRHSSAVRIFNKQNITFSFSIHTFCFFFLSFLPSFHSSLCERKKKTLRYGSEAYESF